MEGIEKKSRCMQPCLVCALDISNNLLDISLSDYVNQYSHPIPVALPREMGAFE